MKRSNVWLSWFGLLRVLTRLLKGFVIFPNDQPISCAITNEKLLTGPWPMAARGDFGQRSTGGGKTKVGTAETTATTWTTTWVQPGKTNNQHQHAWHDDARSQPQHAGATPDARPGMTMPEANPGMQAPRLMPMQAANTSMPAANTRMPAANTSMPAANTSMPTPASNISGAASASTSTNVNVDVSANADADIIADVEDEAIDNALTNLMKAARFLNKIKYARQERNAAARRAALSSGMK